MKKERPELPQDVVMLAVTEHADTQLLWNTALNFIQQSGGDLTVLFFADERWEQAAKLPISIEISSLTGESCGFTMERAQQLNAESARSTRHELQQLASACEETVSFDFYPDALAWSAASMRNAMRITVVAPKELTANLHFSEIRNNSADIVFV